MGTLVTEIDGRVIARGVARANSEVSKTVGLLTKATLSDEDGMWFPSCKLIHTWGMRTAIDVIFLGARYEIVRIVEWAKPWRVYAGGANASAVVELAPGTVRRCELRVGEVLRLDDAAPLSEA